MIKNIFFSVFIVLLGLSSACTKEQKNYILEKKALKPLIIDIHIADAMNRSRLRPDTFGTDTALYNHIFRRHGVTKVQFDSTVSWYLKNKPNEYNKLYEDIITQLSKIEGEIDNKRQKKSAKKKEK
jgi:hypothetical protein